MCRKLLINLGWMSAALLSSCASPMVCSQDTRAIETFRQDGEHNIIRVEGLVRHPGKLHLKPGQRLSLSEALSLVGGTISRQDMTDGPALNDIRVLRLEGDRIVAFKLNVMPGNSGADFSLQRGDSVYVPMVVF